jgi:glutamyl-tRNA synthetase
MGYASAAPRLAAMGIVPRDGAAFWLAVRGNLGRFSEVADWWTVVNGPVTPVIDDSAFAAAALAALPLGEPDAGTWKLWTEAVKASTGAKGRALFMPLRLALTGREHGPELAPLLPLIGRVRLAARLAGQTA